MAKIIYITGGQRSGKSEFAEEIARSLTDKPVYLATSRIWDDEFKKRVDIHKSRRLDEWENIEEEKYISNLNLSNKTVLLDCITLWLTNFFYDNSYDVDKSLVQAKQEWDKLIEKETTLIVVSNEIGLGVVPVEKNTRRFIDLQGWMNQHIAKQADEVYFMVSGIAQKIK
ncbi:MAG: bifunctional adenosylcobinamide kinase/adenosylcobinamide-phosphate guanylyltransferase [Marinifilaceae bacterium]|jgi:adenosylcobinamide kinase/adenosylcobinamide-phosphate guanylyltransferase|nr:bifunctional adenosylcobinamide kinase/adenosylcobinamide-phosphate guanylyltransferase [Marinifilaceae bacterium]